MENQDWAIRPPGRRAMVGHGRGPPGRGGPWAAGRGPRAAGRGPRAAGRGPLGRGGPWAAGLLLAKPIMVYEPLYHDLQKWRAYA